MEKMSGILGGDCGETCRNITLKTSINKFIKKNFPQDRYFFGTTAATSYK